MRPEKIAVMGPKVPCSNLSTFIAKQKTPDKLGYFAGGESGIRTRGTVRYTHFPGVRLRPLGHLTNVPQYSLFM